MLGFSSDGDVRLLNAMKHFTKFDSSINDDDLFSTRTNEMEFDCIQDPQHIGTKARNRSLKPSVVLPIGNKIASVSHLKILINNVEKNAHGLVMKDICPDDRQNFASLQKIMSSTVLDALSEYVIDSEATVMYFKLCAEIVSSFIDLDLSPKERIYRLWHATYFLRIWKMWLDDQHDNRNDIKYTVRENFISMNAYTCIEINAKNIIRLIRKLRSLNLGDMFVPHLFSSQPCEQTFRQLRSMGTTNFTKINFSLLEVMHMIGRVEIQNNIIYSKLANMQISFPQNKINSSATAKFQLPSDIEIQEELLKAKNNAIKDAINFGMECSDSSIRCNLTTENLRAACNRKRKIEEVYVDTLIHCTPEKLSPEINENSKFVEIESQNTKKMIRKSTYVWLLSDSPNPLSSDRLKRVQGAQKQRNARKRLFFPHEKSTKEMVRAIEIQLGDWCVFLVGNGASDLMFGRISSFKYIAGKNEREKQYTWDFAPVVPQLPEDKQRGISVMSSWYHINSTMNITQSNDLNCFYTNIDNYVATLKDPKFEKTQSGISLTKDYVLKNKADFVKLVAKE